MTIAAISNVLSGVSQGLVLGPLLFYYKLIINYLPAKLSFTISDDVILYREIKDILILQEVLSAIAFWAQDW